MYVPVILNAVYFINFPGLLCSEFVQSSLELYLLASKNCYSTNTLTAYKIQSDVKLVEKQSEDDTKR